MNQPMAQTINKQRKLTRAKLVALLTLLALLVPTATALACPVTNLADLEDEVMCVVCGTPLGAAGGPQAERERDFIRQRVDSCKTKEQIKTALVAEYGDEVLALPRKSG
ncbi:MAG: cytochrome c-type biogenesis protein CcmH, partial [Thermoleophilaceae bacterium]|nr:cytochrome c-type biogenesis protein CcmH [Thermoleophilaceae bacterium]